MALKAGRADRIAAILTGAVALCVYLLTLAPDLLPGDSGEFQMAAPLLSIVHPTGYPLYLLSAKAFTLIPFGTLAYRVNLFSAVTGALAVGVLCYAIIATLARVQIAPTLRRIVGVAFALAFAFTPTFWAQATEAEVYALHALFVVALIGIAASIDANPARRVLWLALAFGLSLTHHRTTILLTPALIVLAWGTQLPWRRWALAMALAAAPMLLYLYTPLRYAATPYMTNTLDASHTLVSLDPTVAGFVGHMLGTGFRGALGWDVLSNLRLLEAPFQVSEPFGGTPGWIVLALALLGAASLWLAPKGGQLRRMVLALVLTFVILLLFNAAYHIGDISDYYSPVYIMTIWLAAIGSARLLARIRRAGMAVMIAACALVLPGALLMSGYPEHASRESMRESAKTVLSAAPRDAILVNNDRDEVTPLLYLQYVDGVRRDVAPLFPLITPELPDVVTLTRYALQTSRPVYLTKPMPGLETVFALKSNGLFERVIGAADTTPNRPLAVSAPGVRLIGWSVVTATSSVSVTLFWEAAASRPNFSTYVHLLGANGDKLAQSDHQPGGDYYPPSMWPVRERIRDEHVVSLPSGVLPARFSLRAGAYAPGIPAVLGGLGQIELGAMQDGR
ncbi:MAG: DUF2723 domain-containing protein [Chloroflexi bacterium]|nr:DUF2723 domain-containing protein [Chloroflexota bacterium]